MKTNHCYQGDCRDVMRQLIADGVRVQTIVTSPPYWNLRDYGVAGQIGMEPTLQEFVATMVGVFDLARELLADDGTLWLNLGDSYTSSGGLSVHSGKEFESRQRGRQTICRSNRAGPVGNLKNKDLCGVPWRVAFALQDAGWYLRQDIIWSKPNPMPESVRDRCTKAHEYLFLLTKSPKYYFDQEAILEPCSPGTHARLAQNVAAQIGSERANGGAKTNGNMKAVARGGIDQGIGQRQGPPGNEAKPRKVYPGTGVGFGRGTDAEQRGRGRVKNNESFDAAMAIMPDKRNKRSVWTIATQSFSARTLGLHGASDDSRRTVSPDCPIHAVQSYLASKAVSDALRAASLSDRNQCSDGRHDLLQQPEPAPIVQRHDEGLSHGSLDLQDQPYSSIAKDHSTQSRKMDHALSTSLREIGDEESPCHTGDNELQHDSAANVDRTPESNTAPGFGSGARVTDRAEQTPSGSVCTCSYKAIIDHFAVFPEALVEPCILAGSRPGDIVFDPFMGSGTVAQVAQRLGRKWIGSELNQDYIALQSNRTRQAGLEFAA